MFQKTRDEVHAIAQAEAHAAEDRLVQEMRALLKYIGLLDAKVEELETNLEAYRLSTLGIGEVVQVLVEQS